MPFAKIKEAVLSCDESVLSEQHLRQMESFAPDNKEVQSSSMIIDHFMDSSSASFFVLTCDIIIVSRICSLL